MSKKPARAITDEARATTARDARERKHQLFIDDVKFLAGTPQGMRFFKFIADEAKLFSELHRAHGGEMSKVVAQHDFGLRLISVLVKTVPEKAVELMIRTTEEGDADG